MSTRLFLVAAVAFMAFTAGCVTSDRRPISQRTLTDETLTSPSIVEQRIERNKKMAKQFPNEPEYLERVANLYWISQKDHEQALRYLGKAKAVDRKNPKYDLLEARIYYALGSYNSAEVAYQEVVAKSDHSHTGPRSELGWFYIHQSKFDQARKLFEECVRIDPELPGPHYALGKLYERSGDDEKAIEHLETYLQLGGGTSTRDALQVLQKLQPELGLR